ncbi:ankyrin, partial [Choiromyces venosus 120613-1]
VVSILLERKDVNPDTADTKGRTPLSWAADKGYPGVVKILLERKGVNPDTADSGGWTPLAWAAAKGREDVVKILLERKDVNPDSADTEGRTPLMWAAESGNEQIEEMLSVREDLNPRTTDFNGEIAPSPATSKGHPAAVKLPTEHNQSLTKTSDIDEVPGLPSSEPSDLPSPEPLDLPQTTSQPVLSSSHPATDPHSCSPDPPPPLHNVFRHCINVTCFTLILYLLFLITPSWPTMSLSFDRWLALANWVWTQLSRL